MAEVLEQFELNYTFFIQLVLFFLLFLLLRVTFFTPFLNLIAHRRRRTVEDRHAAEKLLKEANEKLEAYQQEIQSARLEINSEFEKKAAEAKTEEARLIEEARKKAKQIAQETAEKMEKDQAQVRSKLENDAEQLAKQLSDKLLKN